MLNTIRQGDSGVLVVVAKLLTGYITVTQKVTDTAAFIEKHKSYDAGFVAHVCAWQRNRDLTPDGVIGPKTWTMIADKAPTCSTSKCRKSGPALAVQLLLDTNITCDAIYGDRTKNAVYVYQSNHGLYKDGVCGPKTWASLIVGSSSSAPSTPASSTDGTSGGTVTPTPGTFKQPVDYKQGDSRWGKKMYSNHGDSKQTMANSACGPTAMADVVATLKDKNVTPYDLAMKAVAWGDRSYNSGTNWSFFPHIAEEYNFSKLVQSKSIDALKACLDAGGYVVCSMGPGYWTTGGHYICAWMYDDTYIYCNDPASSSRKKQKIADFVSQRKQFFCFYPDPVIEDNGGGEPLLQQPQVGTRGTKIIDIARYQGTVDWDKLAPELAFVIIKASGLYKNGADTQYANNVKGAVSHGVPFHAYHFLYCTSEAEAKRDAKLFYDTVAAQGYMPLFWVLDCEKKWGVSNSKAKTIAEVFEAELRRLAGADIKVAIYIGHNVYKAYALDYNRYAYRWIPRYGSNNGTIEGSIKPDFPCDLWQYTSTDHIAGIAGNVDMNVITGDGHDLAWFLGGD